MKDKCITVTTTWRMPISRLRRNEKVPAVKLSGEWLGELGFNEGERVIVAGEPGRLVLTLAEPRR